MWTQYLQNLQDNFLMIFLVQKCPNLSNNQLRRRFQRLNPTFTRSPNMGDPPSTPSSPICSDQNISKIPIEIISEEEMALIEAAAAAIPLTQFHRNARSVRNITLLSKRRLSACTKFGSPDIEDSGHIAGSKIVFEENAVKNKKSRVADSFLRRFRKGRGLSITDLTGAEWCEKQIEFGLLFGKPKPTAAMKAGSARHAALEEDGIKRVKVHVKSAEDVWALKLINFILGANQLLSDGWTRELPLVGFVEGVWLVGVIDEIRTPLLSGSERIPVLVDTKTRVKPTIPGEPQKRNGRLQLMCYKYLWDSVVAAKFPTQKFFEFFSLNPNQILSQEIRGSTAEARFPSQTLNDLVNYFGNSCCLLPRAHDRLLLRYELQEDQSLIGEDEFDYEPDWVKGQIKSCLEFWTGEREARYPPMEERWKCRHCKFSNRCPATSSPDASSSQSTKEDTLSPQMPL